MLLTATLVLLALAITVLGASVASLVVALRWRHVAPSAPLHEDLYGTARTEEMHWAVVRSTDATQSIELPTGRLVA